MAARGCGLTGQTGLNVSVCREAREAPATDNGKALGREAVENVGIPNGSLGQEHKPA